MITHSEIQSRVSSFLSGLSLQDKRVLLVIPDATRTAPVGDLFKVIHENLASVAKDLDVMVALGTHKAMSESEICTRLDITLDERNSTYGKVQLLNHEWDNPEALQLLGTIPAAEISELSGGLFSMDVDVTFNKTALTYDQILILGPVFPHEVVGFSGGNKCLFPGIGGPEILNFFHWLGAVISNAKIIGNGPTPVRKVVDRAAQLVPVAKAAICMVVSTKNELVGLFCGTPEDAWRDAAVVSNEVHIVRKPKAFKTVLSRCPLMYDDLWVGGKAMYKLEPVVEDGGELIIYAPHITEVSPVHGALIEEIGYHCRDYFLADWEHFKNYPWGVVAHSTHVRGQGVMENGVEKCRIKVTLATGIPKEICEKISLGWVDYNTINIEDYENREDEGILYVAKAGEMLYRLEDEPEWAKI